MPWFQRILGSKQNRLSVISSIFRDAIVQVNGVLGVYDLVLDYTASTRALSVAFRAVCTEGEIIYNREFIV